MTSEEHGRRGHHRLDPTVAKARSRGVTFGIMAIQSVVLAFAVTVMVDTDAYSASQIQILDAFYLGFIGAACIWLLCGTFSYIGTLMYGGRADAE